MAKKREFKAREFLDRFAGMNGFNADDANRWYSVKWADLASYKVAICLIAHAHTRTHMYSAYTQVRQVPQKCARTHPSTHWFFVI